MPSRTAGSASWEGCRSASRRVWGWRGAARSAIAKAGAIWRKFSRVAALRSSICRSTAPSATTTCWAPAPLLPRWRSWWWKRICWRCTTMDARLRGRRSRAAPRFRSLGYVATQCLFWNWYGAHYHPEKRVAVVAFQAAILLLFLLADLAPNLRRQSAGWEECIRLTVNPFVFYATCYFLLDDDRHEWMAPLALAMAILYAAVARAELALRPADRRILLVTAGTALTFVTLAIPVQLESNWITIGWGVEALLLLWASFEAAAPRLRSLSGIVFAAAVLRFLLVDTPWDYRAAFTPVFNRYFLGMLALASCLACAAY